MTDDLLERLRVIHARLGLAWQKDGRGRDLTSGYLRGQRLDRPAGLLEQELIDRVLRHAHAAFEEARTDRHPGELRRGRKDLALLAERRLPERLPEKARRRMRPMIETVALAEIGALLALERDVDLLETAERFRARFPDSSWLQRVEAAERVALARRLRSGPVPAAERRLLQERLEAWLKRANTLSATEQVVLGDALLTAKRFDGATRMYGAALEGKGEDPELDLKARLGLVRCARRCGSLAEADRHLQGITGPRATRVEVRLERIRLLRAREEPIPALRDCLSLIRTLPPEVDGYWDAAEQAAHAYVEAGERNTARTFYAQLRRIEGGLDPNPERSLRVRAMGQKLGLE